MKTLLVSLVILFSVSSAFAKLTCAPKDELQKAAMQEVMKRAEPALSCVQDMLLARSTPERIKIAVTQLGLILDNVNDKDVYSDVLTACRASLKERELVQGLQEREKIFLLGRLSNENFEAAQVAFGLMQSSLLVRVLPGPNLYYALLNQKHCQAEGLPLDRLVTE